MRARRRAVTSPWDYAIKEADVGSFLAASSRPGFGYRLLMPRLVASARRPSGRSTAMAIGAGWPVAFPAPDRSVPDRVERRRLSEDEAARRARMLRVEAQAREAIEEAADRDVRFQAREIACRCRREARS